MQIIDFQTQQHKLFPNIALAYALHFTKRYMIDSYTTIYEQELSRGQFDSVPEVSEGRRSLGAWVRGRGHWVHG